MDEQTEGSYKLLVVVVVVLIPRENANGDWTLLQTPVRIESIFRRLPPSSLRLGYDQ